MLATFTSYIDIANYVLDYLNHLIFCPSDYYFAILLVFICASEPADAYYPVLDDNMPKKGAMAYYVQRRSMP